MQADRSVAPRVERARARVTHARRSTSDQGRGELDVAGGVAVSYVPVVADPVVPIVVDGPVAPVLGLNPDDIDEPIVDVPPVVPETLPLVLPVAPIVPVAEPVVLDVLLRATAGGYDGQPQLFALWRIVCVLGS